MEKQIGRGRKALKSAQAVYDPLYLDAMEDCLRLAEKVECWEGGGKKGLGNGKAVGDSLCFEAHMHGFGLTALGECEAA